MTFMAILNRSFLTKIILSATLTVPLFSFPFQFDFSSLAGSRMVFDGNDHIASSSIGTFQFTRPAPGGALNPNGHDFAISSNYGSWPGGDDVLGDLVGLQGRILGTFGIQSPIITTGGEQTANVITAIGPSRLELYNAASLVMTADLAWSSIQTAGTSGTLNQKSTLNLSNFSCVGPCAGNLAFLASTNTGVATITFQNTSPQPTLTALTEDGKTTEFRSYSGTATVPEPGFYGILALGLSGLSWIAMRRSRHQAELS